MTLALGLNAKAADRVLEPKDLFHMQWVSDPQINKNGTGIAYVRTANDVMADNQVRSIWVVDTASGVQTPIAADSESATSPRWSPDGSKIAFLTKGGDGRTQLMVHWVHGQTAIVSRLEETPPDLTWSPDGTQIAFIMLATAPGPKIGTPLPKPPGAHWADGPTVVDSINFRADGLGWDKPGYRHIYVTSLEGGDNPRALTSGLFSDAGPLAWSPNGQSLYYAGNHNPDWNREPEDWARHTAMTLSIFRLSTVTGESTQLTHEVGPYHGPAVSPDGRQVAYLGFEDRHLGYQNVRVFLMDADGQHSRSISDSFDRSPLDVQWAGDGKSLFILYVDKGVAVVGRLRLDGRVEAVASPLARIGGTQQMPGSGGEFTVSEKGAVAYTGGSADDLPQLYLARDGKAKQLTDLNAVLFKSVTLGKLTPLPTKSSVDKREVGAWELTPPNFDPTKKYPLLLDIHGGPFASYAGVFSAEHEMWAAAGYIVVYGNPRGSTSYGAEFANLINKNYPSQDYDDLMSIVDEAIQRGGVDTDNLFVTGISGGGVLTAWIVGKTHRFKAAVTQRPVIDWTSWLLNTDMSAFGARYWFDKFPWEDQAAYWQHSPLSLVGNVTTPTMVIVGMIDMRCPPGQGEEFYQALQLRHVPTELYEESQAAHGLARPSQLAQRVTAIEEWFSRYRSGSSH